MGILLLNDKQVGVIEIEDAVPELTGIVREVNANGKLIMPTHSFVFKFPDSITSFDSSANAKMFYGCSGLISVDFNNIISVIGSVSSASGDALFRNCTSLKILKMDNLQYIACTSSSNDGMSSMSYWFEGDTALQEVNFTSLKGVGDRGLEYAFQNCTGLISANFPELLFIRNYQGLGYAFNGCTKLNQVSFPKLNDMSNAHGSALGYAFQNCNSLTSLSFPSLTSTSFGSYTNQFNNMLSGVTGCTVHFPSNLQSVIGSWTSVTNGFSGSNTTVLFDLTATS